METRISTGSVEHKKETCETYVPEFKMPWDNEWKPILPKGSYILKTSMDPVDVCKACDGRGEKMNLWDDRKKEFYQGNGKCTECGGRCFRKGTAQDNLPIAEFFVKRKLKEHKVYTQDFGVRGEVVKPKPETSIH